MHSFGSQDFQHLLVNKKVKLMECQGIMCQGASLVLDVKECCTVLALYSINNNDYDYLLNAYVSVTIPVILHELNPCICITVA